jgi:hypothetical protein
MRGAIPPLPQCAFIAWRSAKAQGDFSFTLAYILKLFSIYYTSSMPWMHALGSLSGKNTFKSNYFNCSSCGIVASTDNAASYLNLAGIRDTKT